MAVEPGAAGFVPAGVGNLPPELQSALLALQAGPAAAAPTAASPDTLTVWFGKRKSPDRGPAMQADSRTADGGPTDRGPAMHTDPSDAPWDELQEPFIADKSMSLDDALIQIYKDGVERRFIELLIREGVIARGDFDIDDVHGWWEKAVTESAKKSAVTGKKITPYDWVELYAGVNGIGGSGLAEAGGTTTSVSKSIQEIDDLDARAAAEQAYASLMGRAPKGREAEAVQEMLNAYAKSHPSISRTTTTTDGEGNTSSSTKTSGGMSGSAAGQMVEDEVRSQPGYAEYQAATTYFNALQQSLGATADV